MNDKEETKKVENDTEKEDAFFGIDYLKFVLEDLGITPREAVNIVVEHRVRSGYLAAETPK